MKIKTKQEATEKIAALLAEATAKLERAGLLADKWAIDFNWTPPTESGTFTYEPGWEGSSSCSWEDSGQAGVWSFDPEEDESDD